MLAVSWPIARALGHFVVQLVAPALQGAGFVVDHVQQLVQVGGERAEFVAGGQGAHAGLRLAFFNPLHGLVHALHRLENAARPAHREPGRERHDGQKNKAHNADHGQPNQPKRRLQIAHIQHADALPGGVQQRVVGRHIPVVHHKGAVQPGLALFQHPFAHGL